MTNDKLEFVVIASGTAIGIISAHVPQADPIKYEAAHQLKILQLVLILLVLEFQ